MVIYNDVLIFIFVKILAMQTINFTQYIAILAIDSYVANYIASYITVAVNYLSLRFNVVFLIMLHGSISVIPLTVLFGNIMYLPVHISDFTDPTSSFGITSSCESLSPIITVCILNQFSVLYTIE